MNSMKSITNSVDSTDFTENAMNVDFVSKTLVYITLECVFGLMYGIPLLNVDDTNHPKNGSSWSQAIVRDQ